MMFMGCYLFFLLMALCVVKVNSLRVCYRPLLASITTRGTTMLLRDSVNKPEDGYENLDAIFGAEFKTDKLKGESLPSSTSILLQEETVSYTKNGVKYPKPLTEEKRTKVMEGFQSARTTFILDSVFISFLGLCAFWYFGSFKDTFSYTIGASLGLVYAWLLTRYVETLNKPAGGVGGGGGGGGGSARFAPVILLVLLYGKNKDFIAIIPELMGFFTSYQLASFIQIFNEDLYNEKGKEGTTTTTTP